MKGRTATGEVVEMEATVVGKVERGKAKGAEVKALTDVLGPQVVVIGEEVHLLSKAVGCHREAVELAERVRREGVECYGEWERPVGFLEVAALSQQFDLTICRDDTDEEVQ